MKGNVLVVEGDQGLLQACRGILSEEGHEVKATASPAEGLALAKQEPFDLIIADLELPGFDGLEFVRQVKGYDAGNTVVLMAHYPSQESIKEALKLGVGGFLPRMFAPVNLIDITRKAVEDKRKEEGGGFVDFTPEAALKVDEIIAGHRGRPGSLIPVLQETQELIGYLPAESLLHIARGLNMPVAEVHGVVSFYAFFSMKPKGRHVVKVCLGTACYVKRAEEIVEKLKEKLGVSLGEVTPDRSFSLESVRCLGACGLAPVVVVDKDTHGSINPVTAGEILDNYK